MANNPGDKLDEIFLLLVRYGKSVTWTKYGSVEGLEEKLHEKINEITKHKPSIGVIYFEKLSDGGYEIRTYESKE